MIQTAKLENNTTNTEKIANRRCIKARLQYKMYLQRRYKAGEATSQATRFALL